MSCSTTSTRDGAFNEIVKDYGHCDAVNLAGLISNKEQIFHAYAVSHVGGFALIFALILHDHIKVRGNLDRAVSEVYSEC
jgi:hypothetical protein